MSYVTILDTASVDLCAPVETNVELSGGASVQINRERSLGSTIGVEQAAVFLIVGAGGAADTNQYHPLVGAGTESSPTPPPSTLAGPLSSIIAPFQLVYPSEGAVTDSVTLRAPNLGNKDRLSFNRVLRETRGGTLIVYADPIWPKIQTLVLSFSALTRGEAQALLTFLDAYLGQEVGLIDWEQRYWRGVVMTPDDPITEDSFNSYSASFQFEGELDETWSPQTIPWLPGTPLRRVMSSRDYGSVNPLEPEPAPQVSTETYQAAADSAIVIGQPLYITPTGNADLACANQPATSAAIGFAITAAAPTFTVNYVTEGKLTLADWTLVAGVATLTPGNLYYLDTATAGRITNVVPSVSGQYIVRLGRATSTTTLDIEIEPSLLL